MFVHEGKILVGKTEEEQKQIALFRQAEQIKRDLEAIDMEAGAGRAVRGLLLAAAKELGITGMDNDTLRAFEARAAELRSNLADCSKLSV